MLYEVITAFEGLLTLTLIDAAYVTPKLLWLRQHDPQAFNAAHCFLNSTGYIVARLTGELTFV